MIQTLCSLGVDAGAFVDARLFAYGGFLLLLLALLALDLGVFHRRPHVVSLRESAAWTAVWVAVATVFGVGVYALYEWHVFGLGLNVPVLGSPGETMTTGGAGAVKAYFAGYLLEKALAMDNVFVIAVIFTSLAIPSLYQHRVLYWGILGAIIMRGLMIFLGAELVARFAWSAYVFGGLLILTGVKMAFIRSEAVDPSATWIVRLLARCMPITPALHGSRFTIREGGRLVATPLLVALLLVEFTDLVFALDSIPAIFAITADPFIVFTSNIMAILGLRSLYFCLAAAVRELRHLKFALIAVLLFAGVKMCLVHTELKIPTDVSLLVVLGLLLTGVGVSIIAASREAAHRPPHAPDSSETPPSLADGAGRR